MSNPTESQMNQWVESLALQFAEIGGLPLIAGRIVGWLMICEPAEQSAEQIAQSIGASRASLSTNLRLLSSVCMVTAITRRGERTRYYRIDPKAWEAVVRMQIAALASFSRITEQGIALVGPKTQRATRIKAAQNVFDWMQIVFENAPPVPPIPENY